jgi:hypothetical protein
MSKAITKDMESPDLQADVLIGGGCPIHIDEVKRKTSKTGRTYISLADVIDRDDGRKVVFDGNRF